MKTKNDGGPAFPQPALEHDSDFGEDVSGLYLNYENSGGMSLRDYFAAKAMQEVMKFNYSDLMDLTPEEVCSDAYLFADAMLKEREK